MTIATVATKVSTLLEILDEVAKYVQKWLGVSLVSTLLEILVYGMLSTKSNGHYYVSTLLEILAALGLDEVVKLLLAHVSTLLEILGLMWLVLVGF